MTHEFKQGDEVEFSTLKSEKWRIGTYIGHCGNEHAIGVDGHSIFILHTPYDKIRPIKKRWRAGIGKPYFYVLSQGDYVDSVERNDSVDDERFEFGNYFRTAKQAEQAAELIKQTLKKFHDDNE